jgi:DNA topoisomerase-2
MLDAKNSNLKSYESHYDNQHVDFTLHFTGKEQLDSCLLPDKETGLSKFETDFKLVSSKLLSTSNMYLFNKHGQIKKYDTILDIIKDFAEVRLEYYAKRKDYLLEKYRLDIRFIEARARFIQEIIAKTLEINNKKKDDIITHLKTHSYPTYDYLLRMPIYSLTLERKQELETSLQKAKQSMKTLELTSSVDIWMQELSEFESQYDKFLTGVDAKPHKKNKN